MAFGEPFLFRKRWLFSSPADCQSATQQISNLRYGSRAAVDITEVKPILVL